MMFQQVFSTRFTPQNQPIPGTAQLPNSAGGFAWVVDDWARLDRFLVLGTEGGTYYIGERQLTVENAQAVVRCIATDGLRTVARIVQVSEAGRAPKNDPALFALALCATVGDTGTRQAALAGLPQVARTGTHLFHFLAYVDSLRGWGRGLRKAVAAWYTAKPADTLAYQAVKYQQRDGWSHRDALRLAHPKAPTPDHNALYAWMVKGWEQVGEAPEGALQLVWALERAKAATTKGEVVELIKRYDLPWEAVPGQWLGDPAVWAVLLPKLPMTALLRNLARLTANGLLTPFAPERRQVVNRLTNAEVLRKARVHPITVLSALKTYAGGQGVRGGLTWQPVATVVDALDQAFYLSFGNVEATHKRIVLALDVSGSMDGGVIAGVPGLSPRVAAAAMAMVTAAAEPNVVTVAFSHEMVPVTITPRMRLDDVLAATAKLPFGRTDCALPMTWALEHKVKADAFVIYTDSETWYNHTLHPAQALQEYRRKLGIPAKLVVVGMTANGFSIADPNDGGMLDVVGFDAATPQLISDFIAG